MAQHKKFWLIVIFFFFAVVAVGIWTFHNNSVQPLTYAGGTDEFQKDGVPNFALPLLDGTSGSSTGKFVKLANIEDQIVLVNFWASWCAPCKVEFPSLIELARKYEDKKGSATGDAPQRLRVIAINVDTDVRALNEFLSANKASLPSNFVILADPEGNTAVRYGTRKLPESYILNKDHKLLRKVIDQQNWVSPEFLAILDKMTVSGK